MQEEHLHVTAFSQTVRGLWAMTTDAISLGYYFLSKLDDQLSFAGCATMEHSICRTRLMAIPTYNVK